jgi:hypothetical protein
VVPVEGKGKPGFKLTAENAESAEKGAPVPLLGRIYVSAPLANFGAGRLTPKGR